MKRPDLTLLRRRYASLDAYGGTRLVTLEDGPGRGLRVIEMRSGGGLEAEIIVDRTFDIGRLSLHGTTLSWHSPNSYAHPALIDPHSEFGQGYLRGISGFLSTCGFDHIRQPETGTAKGLPLHPGDHIAYPLHGGGAHRPATLIGHGLCETAAAPYLWAEGQVVQSMTFRGALRLTRRIEIPLGGTEMRIRDRVDNIGPHPAPNMMLYHFNTGHPLVDEQTTIDPGNSEQVWQNTLHDVRAAFGPPSNVHRSELSVHRAASGRANCKVTNPANGMSLNIAFDTSTLPCLQLLRLSGAGYYMVGIEPATTTRLNRKEAEQAGELPILAAGEGRRFSIDIALSRNALAARKA